MTWTKSQKRCFQRIICGFRRHGRKRLRFLTLTTDKSFEGDINKCFSMLRMRINKLSVNTLLRMGYVSKSNVSRYYGRGIDYDSVFPFDFIKVRTSEGNNGVIHCIYFGRYIPQKWLSEAWNDITNGSYIVDIRECKKRVYEPFRLARYCVSQYISGQSDYISFNCSKNWCFQGFIKTWYNVKKIFSFDSRIKVFNYIIDCLKEGREVDMDYVRSFPKRP